MDRNASHFLSPDPKFATKAIHVGQNPEKWKSMAVAPPISLSTTFKQLAPGEHVGYSYSRIGNPTRQCLDECLASLDNADYGLTFASGSAATDCITHLLKSGDHIVSSNNIYGGTQTFFQQILSKHDIKTDFVDCTNIDKVERAITENTRMIWVESLSNPKLRLVDVAKIAKISRARGNIILVVDNTFMTPYFHQPLSLGADIAYYSLSKYMNGHSDVIMGAITTNDKEIYEKMQFLQQIVGCIPSPFDCYLVNRGLKTLHLRMPEHMKNSMEVAKFLEKHPNVESVLYPGLPSHPEYELAKSQCSGYTGMVSFYIDGGLDVALSFFKNLKVFTMAKSLGGTESLASHPVVMSHVNVPPEERKALKINDNLIRLSVGLESIKDLLDDLDQALLKSKCDNNSGDQ